MYSMSIVNSYVPVLYIGFRFITNALPIFSPQKHALVVHTTTLSVFFICSLTTLLWISYCLSHSLSFSSRASPSPSPGHRRATSRALQHSVRQRQ